MDLFLLGENGWSFFDYDATYLSILYQITFYVGVTSLTWVLYGDPKEAPKDTNDKPISRIRYISGKMLTYYSIGYTLTVIEFYPFDDLTLNFAVCLGFTGMFWLALVVWLYNYRDEKEDEQETISLKKEVGWFLYFLTLGIVGMYSRNLIFGPKLLLVDCGHWITGGAMSLQMKKLMSCQRKGYEIPTTSIWVGILLTAVARILQLLHLAYLWQDSKILYQMEIASAAYTLLTISIPIFKMYFLDGYFNAVGSKKINKDEDGTTTLPEKVAAEKLD